MIREEYENVTEVNAYENEKKNNMVTVKNVLPCWWKLIKLINDYCNVSCDIYMMTLETNLIFILVS